MIGVQDPNRMLSMHLGADQVTRRVNDFSKAVLRDDWQFSKPLYGHANPAPMVSPWSSYFAAAHLLIRPDATWEVLLNAIRHPYARHRRRWCGPTRKSPCPPAEGRRQPPTSAQGVMRVSFVFRIS